MNGESLKYLVVVGVSAESFINLWWARSLFPTTVNNQSYEQYSKYYLADTYLPSIHPGVRVCEFYRSCLSKLSFVVTEHNKSDMLGAVNRVTREDNEN